jgi:hypothetical protein
LSFEIRAFGHNLPLIANRKRAARGCKSNKEGRPLGRPSLVVDGRVKPGHDDVAHPKSHALSQERCSICPPIAPNKNSSSTPNECHGRGFAPQLFVREARHHNQKWIRQAWACAADELRAKDVVLADPDGGEMGDYLPPGRRRSQPGREVQFMPRRQELMAGGLISECGRPLFRKELD